MATDGDIRVLAGMDLVLSLVFATLVVWGISFLRGASCQGHRLQPWPCCAASRAADV